MTAEKKNNKTLVWLVVAVAVVLLAVVVTLVLKPSLANSVAQLFSPTTRASQDADVLGKYPVSGTADSGTLLVKFKTSTSKASINSILSKTKTKQKREISKIGTRELAVPANASIGQLVKQFKAMKEVEYAEPNFMATALMTPNDPLYSSQWGLQKMQAPTAWDTAKGNYGPIAVVDTGILTSHPDLTGGISNGYNFVSNSTNANDDQGHGTHVAGIIAAVTNNGTGVSSIGYKGSLIPVKVLDSSGSGSYAAVASGIIYAADRGAKVINLSLGGPSASTTLQNAVNYANSKGAYVIAAAGNSASSSPLYPAACTGAIAISATDSNDNLATFSSYGKNVYSSAPGVSINSTYLSNSYRYLSGTSMSTPQFSGLMELALGYASSTGQTISKADMLNFIKSTSDKVGPYSYDSNGWNQYFGYGRINANKLISLISTKVPAPTPTPSPSISPSPSPSPVLSPSVVPSSAPPALPAPSKFNVVLSGTIDSISADKKVITLKVSNMNQSLKLNARTIVDLKVTASTTIKRNGKKITVSGLKVGDKLSNVKAIYDANSLSAVTITASGR